jgi:hypothetical protein
MDNDLRAADMSYFITQEASVSLAWATPGFTGNPATSDYFDLTLGHNDLGISATNATTLSLPAGTYHVRATLGGTKPNGADYVDYQWELGGVNVGNHAGWDNDNTLNYKMSTEYAEAVFSITTATALRLVCKLAAGSCVIQAEYSGVVIRGAAL